MTESIRVGVIGLGFGALLVEDFSRVPGVEVTAVADHSARHLRVPRDEFRDHYGLRWYEDGRELLESEQLDAVSICTPPASHRELVEMAAARRVHVLLEKPMAASVDDCVVMRRACDQAGVVLQMEFPMRELPAVAHCRRLITDGTIGKPLLLSADYVMGPIPPEHWMWNLQNGGSPINENTCHVVDTLRFLAGDVVEVSALTANLRGNGAPTPDCAAFSLRFASGAIASVVGGAVGNHSSRLGQRVDLYCEAGQAVIAGRFHTFHRLEWHDSRLRFYELDYGAPPVAPSDLDAYETFPLHIRAVESFVDAVRERTPHGATGKDGQAAVQICLAVLEAGRTGRAVQLVAER